MCVLVCYLCLNVSVTVLSLLCFVLPSLLSVPPGCVLHFVTFYLLHIIISCKYLYMLNIPYISVSSICVLCVNVCGKEGFG